MSEAALPRTDAGPADADGLIGVGCDTEERARLARALQRDPGFLQRWYSPSERAAIDAADDPIGLALRIFCLKEAAVKALWSLGPLGPDAVEALPRAKGFRLALRKPGLDACLQGSAGADADHAWAEVLAFRAAPPSAG
jgi:hypothetical protein